METSGEKEETANDASKTTTEGKSWWETIADGNPQLQAIFKILANPVVSIGSLAGLAYMIYANIKEKESAQESLNNFKKEVAAKIEELTQENETLKKKNKKLKKKLFAHGDAEFSSVNEALNGSETLKNIRYKTSYLD